MDNLSLDISLRIPNVHDAAAVSEFVRNCPPLECNSGYAYLLLCTHFAESCVIASDEDGITGFIGGYRPETHRDTVFVWQIGVHERARGMGIGNRMLHELANRVRQDGVRYLEATVTPTNEPSRRMFVHFANSLDVPYTISEHFGTHLFGAGIHEPEDLFRLGPF